jgi:hypothetical protein
MPHEVGGNEPILYRGRRIGRCKSGDLHISYSLDWNFTGIRNPGMLLHLRSVGNLDVQLIAGAN